MFVLFVDWGDGAVGGDDANAAGIGDTVVHPLPLIDLDVFGELC